MTKMPVAGRPHTLRPGLTAILAPNPSPMTHWGTNTYLIGEDDVAIVDPGPRIDSHLQAILSALGGRRVSHILVTHAHLDHSALVPDLQRATGAPVLAFGPAEAGRTPVMEQLAREGGIGGGEGVDTGFVPDETIRDGDRIEGQGFAIDVLHTPGHFAGHLSFALGDTLLSGDHVMAWSTTLISPPDGDVAAFRASCNRLLLLDVTRLLPAHGPAVTEPQARINWLLAHRAEREAQILETLAQGESDAATLARRIYHDLPPTLIPAATRNVLAHLIDLAERGQVAPSPSLSADATFVLI